MYLFPFGKIRQAVCPPFHCKDSLLQIKGLDMKTGAFDAKLPFFRLKKDFLLGKRIHFLYTRHPSGLALLNFHGVGNRCFLFFQSAPSLSRHSYTLLYEQRRENRPLSQVAVKALHLFFFHSLFHIQNFHLYIAASKLDFNDISCFY